MEDRPLTLQLETQLLGVGQVAVVGQRHAALIVVDQNGLDVALVVRTGGTVAHMADGDIAKSQRAEPLLGKHIADQPHVPPGAEQAVIVDNDTGTFLPAVLKGVQSVIG